MDVVIPYDYRTAFLPFHQRTQREAVIVAHRRMGKTVAIDNDAQLRCLANKRTFPPPRYAWFYPTRVRAKDIAWPYLKWYSENIPGRKVIESELAIEYPNKGRVTLYGADGARGVGLWLDGVYYDECDDIPPSVIADVAPALADQQGFSVYAGMLRGRHNLWKRYENARKDPRSFTLLGRASETGIIPPSELSMLRSSMGEAAYEMQMECNPNASIAHAIYGAEMDAARRDNRVTRVAWVPNVPVHWFADIGHSLTGDDWAWWAIQFAGRDILLQDYFSKTGELPAYYAAEIRKRTEAAECPMGYVYLPHDGHRLDRKGTGADDDLRAAGITAIKLVPRTPNLWTSINYARALFRMFFVSEERCSVETTMGMLPDGTPWVLPSGLDCLDYYTKREPKDGEVEDRPEHNRYSHGADALRTMTEAHKLGLIEGSSMTSRETVGKPAQPNVLRGYTPTSYPGKAAARMAQLQRPTVLTGRR